MEAGVVSTIISTIGAVGIADEGGSLMADLYYKLIVTGKRTIDQVPANLRPQVQAMLNAG